MLKKHRMLVPFMVADVVVIKLSTNKTSRERKQNGAPIPPQNIKTVDMFFFDSIRIRIPILFCSMFGFSLTVIFFCSVLGVWRSFAVCEFVSVLYAHT